MLFQTAHDSRLRRRSEYIRNDVNHSISGSFRKETRKAISTTDVIPLSSKTNSWPRDEGSHLPSVMDGVDTNKNNEQLKNSANSADKMSIELVLEDQCDVVHRDNAFVSTRSLDNVQVVGHSDQVKVCCISTNNKKLISDGESSSELLTNNALGNFQNGDIALKSNISALSERGKVTGSEITVNKLRPSSKKKKPAPSPPGKSIVTVSDRSSSGDVKNNSSVMKDNAIRELCSPFTKQRHVNNLVVTCCDGGNSVEDATGVSPTTCSLDTSWASTSSGSPIRPNRRKDAFRISTNNSQNASEAQSIVKPNESEIQRQKNGERPSLLMEVLTSSHGISQSTSSSNGNCLPENFNENSASHGISTNDSGTSQKKTCTLPDNLQQNSMEHKGDHCSASGDETIAKQTDAFDVEYFTNQNKVIADFNVRKLTNDKLLSPDSCRKPLIDEEKHFCQTKTSRDYQVPEDECDSSFVDLKEKRLNFVQKKSRGNIYEPASPNEVRDALNLSRKSDADHFLPSLPKSQPPIISSMPHQGRQQLGESRENEGQQLCDASLSDNEKEHNSDEKDFIFKQALRDTLPNCAEVC